MNAIRQFVSPSNGRILIEVPAEYHQKLLEVIILPTDEITEETQIEQKMTQFLQALPIAEPDLSDAAILAEVKAVRTARYDR